MKLRPQKNDRGFHYLEFKSGCHGSTKTRVWVRPEMMMNDGLVDFPCRARIHRTEKGNLVLVPDDRSVTYIIRVASGYRGSASIERIDGGDVVAQGHEYHSPLGSLGETAWAIVVAPGGSPITVDAHVTGRRVTKTNLSYRYFPDGRVEDRQEDDLAEILS